MTVVIRNNLASISTSSTKKNVSQKPQLPVIGKVFGVVLNETTPSKQAFEAAGGWSGIGTIFYKEYQSSKTENPNETFQGVEGYILAKPLDPTNQVYPLLGELVYITTGPSPVSQIDNTGGAKYYTSIINIYNNSEQNSNTEKLGSTFTKNNNIRRLYPFEGDKIILGRKGNGIRFGSTVSSKSNINEWSSVGPNGDPIIILVNGYVTKNTNSLSPNIEEINEELSSIYMTSTQKLPLIPGALITNPIFPVLSPSNYVYPQVILNSDRVTINSKKDEVLLYAKTNIGLNTDNNIILNAGKNIHLNIESTNPNSKILLGTKSDGTVPDEPILLGDQTVILLEQLVTALNALGGYLSSAAIPTVDGPYPLTTINNAGDQLLSDMKDVCDQLLKITSQKVYTV